MLRAWHDLAMPDIIVHGLALSAEQNMCALCGGGDDDGPEGYLVGPFRMGGKGNTSVVCKRVVCKLVYVCMCVCRCICMCVCICICMVYMYV